MLITLKKVTVNKYKSIQKAQEIEIDPAITTIVGMNESGKTTFLQAIAKTNYFNNDSDFEFDTTQDFPRNELIDFQGSGQVVPIVTCHYEISQALITQIEEQVGKGVFSTKSFSYTSVYDQNSTVTGISANQKKYLENIIEGYALTKETKQSVKKINSLKDVAGVTQIEGDTDLPKLKADVKKIIDGMGKVVWDNPLEHHIWATMVRPKMPKYWYFDDYYSLPGKIRIEDLKGKVTDENLKTAKALFELAKIQPDEILTSPDYERFVALLEASSNKITKEIFKYWTTNQNLDIEFRIQEIKDEDGRPEKYLDIRVKSLRHKVTLPLDRRSKGFNWFFSFIVWFSKIQADKNSDYILLLDEPGLNLHAAAQADLLKFVEELSKKYQIIYTTHSPFMIESGKLDRVRTCLETEEGTIISESIQEKDPKTLFPLQAALGYDIAQNLFISKNNLLVEGPADLIYLNVMSAILEGEKRTGLSNDITIVPVGGLDKVATFISLLKGQKLEVGCLLDSFTDTGGKQRVDDLIKHKIVREKNIRFFNEFSSNGRTYADIEDLFSRDEYVKLFNATFEGELQTIKVEDLDSSLDTVVKQISKVLGKKYNHYRPAYVLNKLGVDKSFFSGATLDSFEKMFTEINKIFK
jgi:predicted ATPase